MIGKTRHNRSAHYEQSYDPEVGKPRGMLRQSPFTGSIKHSRRAPAADVAVWIAHYWMVSWDFRGRKPHVIETLPHPNVHLVFEENEARITGVQTGKFSRLLEGRSRVFGVKFRPGGFRPFFGASVSKLTDRTIRAHRIFAKEIETLRATIVSSSSDAERMEAANSFFRTRAPKPDAMVGLASRLVETILHHPEITSVDHLSAHAGIAKRTLQRIFREYVGATPKWVIRRFRLHELIEKLNQDRRVNWSQLAVELGYFDQAHLINDLKSITGCSPRRYLKRAAISF